MHRSFAALLLCPSLLAARTTNGNAWAASLSGVQPLGNGECRPVYIDLKDSTGKDWPRRPDGQRVSLADFDMTASPADVAVGLYSGAASWSVCACQGAAVAAAITVTATYPADKLASKLRVPGVAFTTSLPVTVKGPVGNSFIAPGCPPAARGVATSAMTAAPQQTAATQSTMVPARAQAVAPAATAAPAATPAPMPGVSSALLAPGDGTLYVSITGTRQGAFRAETPQGFVARSLSYEATAQLTSTGLRSGRRQWSPVTISVEWSAATPQMMSAWINNEPLTVTIERRRSGGSSTDPISESIVLKTATVANIKHVTDGKREVDEVSFTVRDITYTNVVNNFMVQDNMVSQP